MNNETANNLVERLTGLPAWGVLIGPAGMQINFGQEIPGKFGSLVGQISVWIQCRTRLFRQGETIVDTEYPLPAVAEVFRSYLENKPVTKAAIDEKNNSLRLLFGPHLLLSVFPEPKSAAKPWMIYDHLDSQAPGFVISLDRVELAPA